MAMKIVTRPRAPARRPAAPRASAATRSSRSRAGAPSTRVERVRDGLRDLEEADPAVEERRDGDLVGGVVGARERAAPLPGLAGERRAAGTSRRRAPRSASVEPGGEVERRRGHALAVGVGERERDRHAHVGVAEVREERAVAEADERVDDRGRMDDDLDPVVRDAEQPVRLDQLEPLVRERGRVHGDLAAHRPGRMRERVGDRDVLRARRACARGTGRRRRSARASRRSPARGPRGTGRAPSARCRPAAAAPRPRRCAATASSPAATRLSLFASASVTPRSSAQSVASTPAKPTIAFSTTSGSARVEQRSGRAADLDVPHAVRAARSSSGCEPDMSAQSSSSGLRVDDLDRLAADRAGGAEQGDAPRLHRRAGCLTVGRRSRQREHDVERSRPGPEERVDPVEHAAVARRGAGRSP